MKRKQGTIVSDDIPQSDRLGNVRAIVQAVEACGTDSLMIAETTHVSRRHVNYRLHSARILGFVDEDNKLTQRGRALLITEQNSLDERMVFRDGVRHARVISLFPQLLLRTVFDVENAASMISNATGLSHATAHRRARVLRSWKRQLDENRHGNT